MDQYIGPNSLGVIGVVLIAIVSGAKRIWQFSYQSDRELAEKDKRIADLELQLEKQRQGSDDRLNEMRQDRDEYKELLFTVTDISKRQTTIAEKVVSS